MKFFKLIFIAGLFLIVVTVIILGGLYLYRNEEKKQLTNKERENVPGSFVKLDAGITHYQLSGPDTGKVIILLNGFSVPYFFWGETYNYLSGKGYRVLRYDYYGRGFSDRPDADYANQLYYNQLHNLIHSLKLKTPVNLIGVSFGGMLATDFTAMYPKLVRKVVLIDPVYEGLEPDKPELLSRYYEATHPRERAESQLQDFKYPQKQQNYVAQYRVQMQFKGFTNALMSTLYNFKHQGRENYERLAKTGKPVLVIWGRDDKTVPYNYSDSIRNILKPQFFPVDDAGHLPFLEQPNEVNPRVVSFLKD